MENKKNEEKLTFVDIIQAIIGVLFIAMFAYIIISSFFEDGSASSRDPDCFPTYGALGEC